MKFVEGAIEKTLGSAGVGLAAAASMREYAIEGQRDVKT
jgi:cysteine synthase